MLIFSSLRKTKFPAIFFRLHILFFFRIFALPKATRRFATCSFWRVATAENLSVAKQTKLTD